MSRMKSRGGEGGRASCEQMAIQTRETSLLIVGTIRIGMVTVAEQDQVCFRFSKFLF